MFDTASLCGRLFAYVRISEPDSSGRSGGNAGRTISIYHRFRQEFRSQIDHEFAWGRMSTMGIYRPVVATVVKPALPNSTSLRSDGSVTGAPPPRPSVREADSVLVSEAPPRRSCCDSCRRRFPRLAYAVDSACESQSAADRADS